MSDTTYINYTAPAVSAEWLNEINNHVWHDTPVSGTTIHNASVITNTPAGGISATNIQVAINELDTKKVAFTRLDDSDGSSLVGFIQQGTGTVTTTVQEKLREAVSVKDFGAVGDDATDCYAAVIAAAAAGNAVHFPFLAGAANVYRFNAAFPTSELAGKTIDVDPGVVLSIGNNNNIFGTSPGAGNLNFAHPTIVRCRDLTRDYTASGRYHQPPQDKSQWLLDSDFDRTTYAVVAGNEFTPYKVLWDTGDTFSAGEFGGTTADAFSFAPVSDGNVHIGLRPVIPGDKLSSGIIPSTVSQLIFVMVRYVGGYAGVYMSPDAPMTDLKAFSKNVGQAMVVSSGALLGQSTHASYAALNSLMSIRVDSWKRFSILLNGVAVITADTPGVIIDAGFGTLPTAGGQIFNAVSLNVGRNTLPTGGRAIGIKIFGDSKSCERYDAWPTYMKEALEFSEGIRNTVLTNLAVAGTSSADALASAIANGVAGASFVIISTGTNDVQGGIPVATTISNISQIITMCQSAGAVPIIIVPSMWYGQAQSGPTGQASLNYASGGLLRAAIIRLCAEKNVKCINPLEFEGPIVANYVNPALSPNLTDRGDPVVYDNIHPTTLSNRLTGLMVARAIMGAIFPFVSTQKESLLITTFLNNWGGTLIAPVINISSSFVATCYGVINALGGAIKADGTIIASIPKNLAPASQINSYVVTDNPGERVILSLSPTGNFTISGVVTSSRVDLSTLTWQVDKR